MGRNFLQIPSLLLCVYEDKKLKKNNYNRFIECRQPPEGRPFE